VGYLTLFLPLLAVGLLALVLKWASSLDTDRAHRKDYGLLREVARVPSATAAREVETQLKRAGVAATTVPAEDGDGLRILVFPGDQATAISVLLKN
jgi:hypothetical protein